MPVIKKNQTFFDVVTQYCGSMEQVFAMALLNNIGITDEGTQLPYGTMLIAATVAEKRPVNAFAAYNIDIATNETMPFKVLLGGIGYMQINTNFIIS